MDVDPILSPLAAAVADGERRKRDVQRTRRQFNTEETEAAAEDGDPVSHAADDTSRLTQEGPESAAGSAYNPENPYHVSMNVISTAVYGN